MVEPKSKLARRAPIVILILAIALPVFTHIASRSDAPFLIALALGAVPAEITRGQRVWTVLSSGFLHLHYGHLLLNILILGFAGSYLEMRLGHRFVLLLTLLGIVGGVLAHVFTYPQSTVPLYGISAGCLALAVAALFHFILSHLKISLRIIPYGVAIVSGIAGLAIGLQHAFHGGIPMPDNLLESDIAHLAGICIGAIGLGGYELFGKNRVAFPV